MLNDFHRYILEIFKLWFHLTVAPFISVVDDCVVIIAFKNVSPISFMENSDSLQQAIDGDINIRLCRKITNTLQQNFFDLKFAFDILAGNFLIGNIGADFKTRVPSVP